MGDYQEVADGLLESAMSTAQIGQDTYGLALNTNTKILFLQCKRPSKMPDFLRRLLWMNL